MRALSVLLVFPALLCAQEFRGTFSGNVTDAQGAAVAKVTIAVTETRTGTKSQTLTSDSGAYTIPFLAPGEYEIVAEVPGFKKFVRAGVSLGMGEHPVIDIRMEVGAVTEAVTVTADSPLIEAASVRRTGDHQRGGGGFSSQRPDAADARATGARRHFHGRAWRSGAPVR